MAINRVGNECGRMSRTACVVAKKKDVTQQRLVENSDVVLSDHFIANRTVADKRCKEGERGGGLFFFFSVHALCLANSRPGMHGDSCVPTWRIH